MVEGIVVRTSAYEVSPENFETINANNAAYSMINDVANSPIDWMFDYYN